MKIKPLNFAELDTIRGCLYLDSAKLLYDYAMLCKLNRCIEFGALFGKSTVCLAHAMKERDGLVVTLDSFGDNPEENVFDIPNTLKLFWETMKKFNVERNVFAIKGDYRQTVQMMSGIFGMAFIDGGHIRELIIPQLEFCWKNVVSGGYIIIHDYGTPEWPDVKTCTDEMLKGWKRSIARIQGHTAVIHR